MYSESQKTEIFNEIISKIIEGKSVNSILAENENMPSYPTLMDWLEQDETKLKRYTRAKEESADSDADRINNIAEKVLIGEYDPNAARVAIDAYKWSAGKKKPKKYGDKIDIDHTTKGNEINRPRIIFANLNEDDEQ